MQYSITLPLIPLRARGASQTRIQTVIDLLLLHPYIGTRTSDPLIRRMITPPYPSVVFYEVATDAVVIHAIRHAARNPSTMPG
jgi:toxin ParE1/3/4